MADKLKGIHFIKIHTRKYFMINPDRDKHPKFLFEEECPVYYAPGLDEDSRIHIRLPEYLVTKLSLEHYPYATGETLERAESSLQNLEEQAKEMILPQVKKKVIKFQIDANALKINHEVMFLVDHGCGAHYSTENLDGTRGARFMSNLDNFNYVDWTESREKWFIEVEKVLYKIEREVHTMLLKPNYDDKGKITGYGYLKGEDIAAMIDAKVFPLNYKVFPMITAGNNEEEKS